MLHFADILDISESFCMRNIFAWNSNILTSFYMSLFFTPLSVPHKQLGLSADTARRHSKTLVETHLIDA